MASFKDIVAMKDPLRLGAILRLHRDPIARLKAAQNQNTPMDALIHAYFDDLQPSTIRDEALKTLFRGRGDEAFSLGAIMQPSKTPTETCIGPQHCDAKTPLPTDLLDDLVPRYEFSYDPNARKVNCNYKVKISPMEDPSKVIENAARLVVEESKNMEPQVKIRIRVTDGYLVLSAIDKEPFGLNTIKITSLIKNVGARLYYMYEQRRNTT